MKSILSRFLKLNKNHPRLVDSIILIILLLLFAIANLSIIGNSSASFDEGFSSYIATLSILEISHYTSLDVHPPLYYILLHFWQNIFSNNISTIRSMSLVWSVISLVLAFLLVRKAFSRSSAWVSVFLLMISPLFMYYSHNTRMYTMSLAICLMATYILVLLHSTRRYGTRILLWVVYAILLALGMWTSYFTILIWISHFIWVIYENYSNTKTFHIRKIIPKAMLLSIALSIILYLPWIPFFISRYATVLNEGFWIGPVSIDTLISTLTTMTVLKPAYETSDWMALAVIEWLAISVLLIKRAYRSFNKPDLIFFRLLLITSFVPIIILIMMSMPPLRPSFTYRYVLVSLCFTIILVGIGLAMLKFNKNNHLKKSATATVIILTLSIGSLNFILEGSYNLDTGKKDYISKLLNDIDKISDSNEPVIISSPYTYYAGAIYETQKNKIYYIHNESLKNIGSTMILYDMPQKRGIKELASFIDNYDSIWIITREKNDPIMNSFSNFDVVQSIEINDSKLGDDTMTAIQYNTR